MILFSLLLKPVRLDAPTELRTFDHSGIDNRALDIDIERVKIEVRKEGRGGNRLVLERKDVIVRSGWRCGGWRIVRVDELEEGWSSRGSGAVAKVGDGSSWWK